MLTILSQNVSCHDENAETHGPSIRDLSDQVIAVAPPDAGTAGRSL